MLLINAIKSGHICQIKHFLKAGIDVNLTDEDGHTPVIHCCFLKDEEKRMKIFKLLLDEDDVDVNKKDRGGRSLLSWISFLGRADMFTLLLDHCHRQLDFDIFDEKGNSLLMLAVLSKSPRMVALLLDVLKEYGFGKQVNCFNDEGMCPLIIAFYRNDHECAKLLVKEGKASISRVLQHIQHPTTRNCYKQNVNLPARGQAFYTFMRAARLDPKNAPKLPAEQELLEFLFSDGTDLRKGIEKRSKPRLYSEYGHRKNSNFETKPALGRRPLSSKAILDNSRDFSRPSSLATVSTETNTSRSKRTFSPSFTGLYEIYSTQISNSYRQGIPTHEPPPPTPPSVPDIQSAPKESDTPQRRTSLQRHSSNLSEKNTKVFSLSKRSSNLTSSSGLAPVKESPFDRQLRLKYARSTRATSVQVAKFPQMPVAVITRNRSTTISQL